MTLRRASAPSSARTTSQTGSRAFSYEITDQGIIVGQQELDAFPRGQRSSRSSSLERSWLRQRACGMERRKSPLLPPVFSTSTMAVISMAFIQGFAHVVNREGCGCNGDQRFHLHACLRGRRYGRLKFNAILA